MAFYQCSVCEYIYLDEDYRSEQNGITAFVKLKEDWRCPQCGSSKDCFQFVQNDIKDKTEKNT